MTNKESLLVAFAARLGSNVRPSVEDTDLLEIDGDEHGWTARELAHAETLAAERELAGALDVGVALVD